MNRVYTDRSRIIQHQRCPRSRWHAYHDQGMGIQSSKQPLPLAVGLSVHRGLEVLLRAMIGDSLRGTPPWTQLEDSAVAAALLDFSTHRGTLELDLSERPQQPAQPQPVQIDDYQVQLKAQAEALGMDLDDPLLQSLSQKVQSGSRDFDDYLYQEQSSLVEGMVRAYSRRRLQPILEEFEVLEVEREGEWLLSRWDSTAEGSEHLGLESEPDYELWFMSCPDALLRSRSDNSLYLLSFKTAASWDIRKAKDAEHDMQGLSEGVEVEKRLGKWYQAIQDWVHDDSGETVGLSVCDAFPEIEPSTVKYLEGLSAPPRILGIQYQFLLKGERWKDKDLSAKFGFDCRVQRSPLIRAYHNHKTGEWNCSWDFQREDGATSKLAWQSWKSTPIWDQPGGVKGWIDKLDSSIETMSAYDSTTGMEPRPLGWKSEAQATGYLAQHPLDEVFIPPITLFRQLDEARDWLEQVETLERANAENSARVHAAADEGERRHLLNILWPQNRGACEYPSSCAYNKLCWGSDDIKRDPIGSGLYKIRVPHHSPELEQSEKISTGS